MVRNPTSCSSNLELGGIIPPSDPSPHWPSSRVAPFSSAWPLVRLVPLGSSCGYHSWRVSAPALCVKGAEYINNNNFKKVPKIWKDIIIFMPDIWKDIISLKCLRYGKIK